MRGYLTKARAQLFSARFDTHILSMTEQCGTSNEAKGGAKSTRKSPTKQPNQRKRQHSTEEDPEVDDEFRSGNEESDATMWDVVDARELLKYKGIHTIKTIFIMILGYFTRHKITVKIIQK